MNNQKLALWFRSRSTKSRLEFYFLHTHGTNRLQCQTDLKFPNVSGRAVDGISWTQQRCRVGVTVQIRLRATAAQCFCALKYVHLTFKVKIQAEGYKSALYFQRRSWKEETQIRDKISAFSSRPQNLVFYLVEHAHSLPGACFPHGKAGSRFPKKVHAHTIIRRVLSLFQQNIPHYTISTFSAFSSCSFVFVLARFVFLLAFSASFVAAISSLRLLICFACQHQEENCQINNSLRTKIL